MRFPELINTNTFQSQLAPTSPSNIREIDVGENSIVLSWDRPEEVNGEIMTYQLWVNGRKINIHSDDWMNETFTYYLRTNLKHYTNYSITVLACNSECSPPSESLNVRTKMGNPAKMLQPSIEKVDDSLLVHWQSPDRAIQNKSYYQMKITTPGQVTIYKISGDVTSCAINLADCRDDKIEVSLRNINVDPKLKLKMLWQQSHKCHTVIEKTDITLDSNFHRGLWSPSMAYYCNSPAWYIIDLLIIAVLVFALLTAYLAFR